MASSKMVVFLHVGRWEKGNRTNFYWLMILMLISSIKNLATQRLDIVQKSLIKSCHFFYRKLCRKIWYSSDFF